MDEEETPGLTIDLDDERLKEETEPKTNSRSLFVD